MEPNKQMGLGERIMNIPTSNIYQEKNYEELSDIDKQVYKSKNMIAKVINYMDLSRQSKIDEENLSIGTIDAIDDLIQRAINKVEEASMLFTKAMYKTNK